MSPNVYMTENEKLRAVGMSEAGEFQNSVAKHFGKSKSVMTGVTISTDGWGQD